MADYGIQIANVKIPDISIKGVALTEVFIKDVQVWEAVAAAGAILTIAIDEPGSANGNHSGLYTVPQDSSDGSGTGAQFSITVSHISNKNRSYISAASIDASNPGSGYASGEIVTLDMSSVSGSWQQPDIEVLTVTT
jgi:hypothetical protein